MTRIKILDDRTVNQIAAGEVIARPASVVKELVENAVDAQAGRIEVKVEEGGKNLVQVSDDGVGMSAADAELALQRHATSKISSPDDLLSLATLGFRGEALPSIASVSKLTLTTRSDGDLEGTKIVVEGGEVEERRTVGCPQGTVVAVKDLFFNTPARAKNLKKPSTEFRRVSRVFYAHALARPDIRFRLFHNGREVADTPGSGDLRDALLSLYDVDFARQLLEVCYQSDDGYAAEGYVGKPQVARRGRSRQFIFVNDRPVKCDAVRSALEQAFSGLLSEDRYPPAVLKLTCPPREVDVNAHPTKREVRFSHPEKMRKVVSEAVEGALQGAQLSPAVGEDDVRRVTSRLGSGAEREQSPDEDRESVNFAREQKSFYGTEGAESYDGPQAGPALSELAAQPGKGRFEERMAEKGSLPRFQRVIGQFGGDYVILEGPQAVYFVDQHAAHERVFFERFRAQIEGQTLLERQELAVPFNVSLTPEEMEIWRSHGDDLRRMGFESELFGPRSVMVTTTPAPLEGAKRRCKTLFGDILDLLGEKKAGRSDEELPLVNLEKAALMMAACKAAIKSNTRLAPEEAVQLIVDLNDCDDPYSCPHGRPTLLKLEAKDLERLFQRT